MGKHISHSGGKKDFKLLTQRYLARANLEKPTIFSQYGTVSHKYNIHNITSRFQKINALGLKLGLKIDTI